MVFIIGYSIKPGKPFLIVCSSYIIKRKIEKTTKKIEEVDRLIKVPTNE